MSNLPPSDPLNWRVGIRHWVGPFPLGDVLIAGMFTLLGLVGLEFIAAYGLSATYALNLLLGLVIGAVALWRRAAVVPSFIITYCAMATYGLLAWLTPVNLGLNPLICAAPVSLWAVTRWAPNRAWGVAGLLLGLVGGVLNPAVTSELFLSEAQNSWSARIIFFGVPAVLIVAVSYAWPAWLRANAERQAFVVQEELQEQRLALSRELHDVVGHGLTAIKVQAQTALYLDDHRDALAQIRDTADTSLADVHALVDALRAGIGAGGAAVTADPASIPAIVERSGARVTPSFPPDWSAAQRWPLHRRLALVRAATELATNMAKHATGPGTFTLVLAGEHATITTSNPAAAAPTPERGGFGLAGLRERGCQVTVTAANPFTVEVTI